MKKGKFCCLIILCALLSGFYRPSAVQAASPAMRRVTFQNNHGKSTAYGFARLNRKVKTGTRIKLPVPPKAQGYQSIGWALSPGQKKPAYRAGDVVTVKKDITFYAVRRKSEYYTLSFYMGNGSSSQDYRALKLRVEEGSSAILPVIPPRAGYSNIGWSAKRNAAAAGYQQNAEFTPKKDCQFYAVQKSVVVLTFYRSTGDIYKVLKLKKGTAVRLPGMKNKSGKTMLGWDERSGKTADPQYQVDQAITAGRSMKLYPVFFSRSEEPDLTEAALSRLTAAAVGPSGAFDRVIFVGDSRTSGIRRLMLQKYANVIKNVKFVCLSKTMLDWLKSEGSPVVRQLVRGRTAVIFNHGVNDLEDADQYVTYMKKLGAKLKKKGCTLFYMSVNPLNNLSTPTQRRPERDVRRFNGTIKDRLCENGDYIYIDCYSYLMKNGYGTADTHSEGSDTDPDDGLHYTEKTYKRIYAYCMRRLGEL